ncbi:response regulator [Halosolutus gelatinilyticus]|uniref:response regulator n=1 Tax=Halosolutus gelatinilyticus TaxID=2931975 RepID=UPI001FF3B40E|nr:response regulator [Halosolutus gelatinilyticus]
MTSAGDATEGGAEDEIDILLVEPNPGDSRLFTETFRDAKLRNIVHTVSDGERALEFVSQHGDYEDAPRPDIILLEPKLPGTTGMELLSELKNEPALRDVHVVVLTSSDTGEEIVRSHGIEADEYLRKPVTTAEFIEFVREVEEFWFAIVKTEDTD